MASSPKPLTERVLARLPGPRVLWIAAWALVPCLNAVANLLLDVEERSAVWEQSRTLVILNYVALTLTILITIWASRRIAERVGTVGVASLADERTLSVHASEMGSRVGPALAAAALALAFAVTAFVTDGWVAAVLRGATWLVLGIAICSFLWTYASLYLALDRVGRQPLAANAARCDPSMGLRPLGDLAFMALWMLLAWLVPLVVTGLPDIVGFTIGVVALAVGLGAFFLSLFRLHRRMLDVKADELALARKLYADAYEPVRVAASLEALDQQRSLLAAADALESRARGLQDWPIDDATVARVITIATSVTAISTARLILDPLGL